MSVVPRMTIRHEPSQQDYAKFGRYVAALLGANAQWNDAGDILEDIAGKANSLDFPVSDSDVTEFWREVADELGIDHDGEDDE